MPALPTTTLWAEYCLSSLGRETVDLLNGFWADQSCDVKITVYSEQTFPGEDGQNTYDHQSYSMDIFWAQRDRFIYYLALPTHQVIRQQLAARSNIQPYG